MNTLICYKKWTTCKNAKKYLEDNNIEFEWRDIDIDNPKGDELKVWVERSGLDISKFFNSRGKIYKDENLKEKLPNMTYEEKIDKLATDGMLVKRPIFLKGDEKVFVGFKEADWEENLK